MGILEQLEGGDRRSIGRADDVAAVVLADPSLFDDVFRGVLVDNPLVRMRAADVVEKVTARRPDLLQPYLALLLGDIASIQQQEVRWHVAQILPRLDLNGDERARGVELLVGYLGDASRIVTVCAMQALAEFAQQDETLKPRVVPIIANFARTGSPAVRARGNKLLARLTRPR